MANQMQVLRLANEHGDALELEKADFGGDAYDLLLSAKIVYRGFSGTVDAWIPRDAWLQFTQALTVLEVQRQGHAQLYSMSPGELELVVRSSDRAGHMCVEGSIGLRSFDAELSLKFSPMTFEPSQLVAFARGAQRVSERLTARTAPERTR